TAAGTSDTPSETTIPAIARYLGAAASGQAPDGANEGDVENVEGFVNYQDLHAVPPPPQIQAIFNRISETAKFIILSQPDDNGVARLDLGALGATDDIVNITIKEAGKDPKPAKGDH